MAKGIRAGDPLIETLTKELRIADIKHKETKLSGAKKGDGDVHTMELPANISFDGKYILKPPMNPKFLTKDLDKITKQGISCDRSGVLVSNYKEGVAVCMKIETLMTILTASME